MHASPHLAPPGLRRRSRGGAALMLAWACVLLSTAPGCQLEQIEKTAQITASIIIAPFAWGVYAVNQRAGAIPDSLGRGPAPVYPFDNPPGIP